MRRCERRAEGLLVPGLGSGLVLAGALLLGGGEAAKASVFEEGWLDAASARVQWRWIGVREGGEEGCDELVALPQDWISFPLFSAAAAGRFPALEDFCVLEYQGAGAVPSADLSYVDALDGTLDHTPPPFPHAAFPPRVLAAGSPDLMAVTPGGSLEDALWPVFASLFDEQAGRGDLAPPAGVPSVRLTLVDTSPTGAGGMPESSVHGRTLRHLARRLLCASGPCLAEVRSRLALAFKTFDPASRSASLEDHAEGGLVGLVSALGAAVTEEVDAWLGTAAAGDRLLLNLSVAWDRLYGGGDLGASPQDFPTPVLAVYRALESAACDDRVLVVAAAGNLSDRHAQHSTQEPLLPAAWRERNAVCPPGVPGPPLLVAVGGVDRQRKPLGNSIPGAMPEVVAYGDHAAVEDPLMPGTPSAVLTGSSVAAVVASSALAAVATYRTDLDLQAVASLTTQGGEALDRTADFCRASFGSFCPGVRALSACEAVAAACSQGNGLCPQTLPSCDARPAGIPEVPGLALPALMPEIDAASLLAVPPPACPICGTADGWSVSGAPPPERCPDRQRHGLGRRPYTHPQPQSMMCPNCGVFVVPPEEQAQGREGEPPSHHRPLLAGWSLLPGPGEGWLLGEIDSGGALGAGQGLTSPTLELECDAGPPRVYHLRDGPLPPLLTDGDPFVVRGLDPSCRRGALSFVLEDAGDPVASVRQPLFFAVQN